MINKDGVHRSEKKIREALGLWVNQINNPKSNYRIKSKKFGMEVTIPVKMD